jgi:hypothetical protein
MNASGGRSKGKRRLMSEINVVPYIGTRRRSRSIPSCCATTSRWFSPSTAKGGTT